MEIAAEQDVESVEEIEQRFVFFQASLISPACHSPAEISSSKARKSHVTQRCERADLIASWQSIRTPKLYSSSWTKFDLKLAMPAILTEEYIVRNTPSG
jgi:hypothetical protein